MKVVEVNIPEYSADRGLQFVWDEGFQIQVRSQEDAVIVRANAAGLRSLARHLLLLSQEIVPVGSHAHFDSDNALEDGSIEFIIEKGA